MIVINNLIIITTLVCKIPPNLPLPAFGMEKTPKGGITPSLAKRGEGRFSNDYVNSIMRLFIRGLNGDRIRVGCLEIYSNP